MDPTPQKITQRPPTRKKKTLPEKQQEEKMYGPQTLEEAINEASQKARYLLRNVTHPSEIIQTRANKDLNNLIDIGTRLFDERGREYAESERPTIAEPENKKARTRTNELLIRSALPFFEHQENASKFTHSSRPSRDIRNGLEISEIRIAVFSHGVIPIHIAEKSRAKKACTVNVTKNEDGVSSFHEVTCKYGKFEYDSVNLPCMFSNHGSCLGIPLRRTPFDVVDIQQKSESLQSLTHTYEDQDITPETFMLCTDANLKDVNFAISDATDNIDNGCFNIIKRSMHSTTSLINKIYGTHTSEIIEGMDHSKIVMFLKLRDESGNEMMEKCILLGPEFENLRILSSLFPYASDGIEEYIASVKVQHNVADTFTQKLGTSYHTNTLSIVKLINTLRGNASILFIDRSCNTIVNCNQSSCLSLDFRQFTPDSDIAKLLQEIQKYIKKQTNRGLTLFGGSRARESRKLHKSLRSSKSRRCKTSFAN